MKNTKTVETNEKIIEEIDTRDHSDSRRLSLTKGSSSSSSASSLTPTEIEAVVTATVITPMSSTVTRLKGSTSKNGINNNSLSLSSNSINHSNSNNNNNNNSNKNGIGSKDYSVIEMPENICSRNSDELLNNESYCKTFLAFLCLFFSMMSNLFVLSIVHERVPRDIKKPLPDLGFDLLPRADAALDVAEYIIVINFLLVALLLFIHRFRQILFRRIAIIISILYSFRAICMISTVFPLANEKYYCSPQLFNSTNYMDITNGEYIAEIFKRVARMSLGFGLSINGQHTYCGDYLYSGHTVTLTICYLTLREYLIPFRCRTLLWKLFNLILFSGGVVGVIAIIVARGHYLIDIILAYYVSTRVFWMYHTFAYNHDLVYSSKNYIGRVWWFPIFQYFELNKGNCFQNNSHNQYHQQICSASSGSTVGQATITARPLLQSCHCDTLKITSCSCSIIPRSFEWPLPWPRSLRRRTLLPYQQSCDQQNQHKYRHQHQQQHQTEKDLHGIRIE